MQINRKLASVVKKQCICYPNFKWFLITEDVVALGENFAVD